MRHAVTVCYEEAEGCWHIFDNLTLIGTAGVKRDALLWAASYELVHALEQAVHALNVTPRFTVGNTDSYAIAAQCDKALAAVTGKEVT